MLKYTLFIFLIISKYTFQSEESLSEFKNTCSGLGINVPTRARDCRIYNRDDKFCCFTKLSLTKKENTSSSSNIEGLVTEKYACRLLEKLSNGFVKKYREELNEKYNQIDYNLDIVLECQSNYYKLYFLFLFSFLILL